MYSRICEHDDCGLPATHKIPGKQEYYCEKHAPKGAIDMQTASAAVTITDK